MSVAVASPVPIPAPPLLPAGPCPVLASLSAAVATVAGLEVPAGLGADAVLTGQVAVLGAAVATLQAQLAVRMAALESAAPPPADVRGEAVRAGVPSSLAAGLRRLGDFAAAHPDLRRAWLAGSVTGEQVGILRSGTRRLPNAPLQRELVAGLLPMLPDCDARATRRLVDAAVDVLHPGDPDAEELADHASRYIDWSRTPGGGMVLQGYLPTPEAEALTAALHSLVGKLRVAGDGLSPGQRRADALSALVAVAARRGLPTSGGLPAALTLTVDLAEAERVALRDPAAHGRGCAPRTRGGSTAGTRPAGDATVRFGLCCATITPLLRDGYAGGSAASKPATAATRGSLLDRIARTPAAPLAVGRAVRLATRAQRLALQLRDRGCAIPGCTIEAAFTEPHHVTPWALGGKTDLANLVLLCWVHHRLTELGRFTFHPRRPDLLKPPGALEHPLYWITTPARPTQDQPELAHYIPLGV